MRGSRVPGVVLPSSPRAPSPRPRCSRCSACKSPRTKALDQKGGTRSLARKETSEERSCMVTYARQIIQNSPIQALADEAVLVGCIEACFDCAQACTACADACLGEGDPAGLVKCIRDDLDCADICVATGRVLSRQARPSAVVTRAVLEACAASCRQCGDTCAEHAEDHGHCRACMGACRQCEVACNSVLSALAA